MTTPDSMSAAAFFSRRERESGPQNAYGFFSLHSVIGHALEVEKCEIQLTEFQISDMVGVNAILPLWRALLRYFWLLGIFMLLAPVARAQASFDCRLAATPVEIAICAHDDLSRLDKEMAGAFRSARGAASEGRRGQILDEQRAWIGRRNACGPDQDCLSRLMRDRIASLSAPVPAQIDGLTGLYCNAAGVMGLVEEGTRLRFDFMFFSDGYACGTETLTAERDEAGWTSVSDGCRLTLTREGEEMIVRTDTVEACQANYCGARAAITEFRMPLTGKAVGISDPFIGGVGERPC